MLTLVLVILIISVLILVHEWGHFYSARKFGVRVEEFGFGFPPRLISRIKNGVRYSFNLLPLGGFVKIFGEHGEGEGDKRSFAAKPAWQRFIILAAGVMMNFLLAWFFFSIGAGIGVPAISDADNSMLPVSIIGVSAGSPAEHVGLKFGDKILELRAGSVSLRVETEKDVRDFIDAYRGEEVLFLVERGKNDVHEVRVTPRVHAPAGEGPVGIGLARLTIIRTSWFRAPIFGAETLGRTVYATLGGLWGIIRDLFLSRGAHIAVSGPVGIFFFAQETRALGLSYFIQFVGILSMNLAILNFLPIPALDGGRILFLFIEKIKGRRVDPRIENFVHAMGFALLLILMLLVTYKDLARIL